MHYNPCGRIVDISRRAYSTECRFFKDSDIIGRVHWMEARPDAEVLPFESVILSRQQEPDDWLPLDVGEVAEAPRTTTLARAPVGSGVDHICGTEQEFREGEEYDPTRPLTHYGSSGLPHCCFPVVLVRAGAGASAHNTLRVYRGLYIRPGPGASGKPVVSIKRGLYIRPGPGASGKPTFSVKPPIRVYGGPGASGKPRVNDLTEWTRDVFGLYTFVPTVTRDHIIELWGAGAGGQKSMEPFALQGGGGGGGGAYARSVVFLTAGTEYEVLVIQGGPPVDSGAAVTNPPTVFGDNVVAAASGWTANPPNPGTGGRVIDSVGEVIFAGGDGAGTVAVTNGGGGGGAAGPVLAGFSALGTAGGVPLLFRGGQGGDGQPSPNPWDGGAPGGGGGGKAVASGMEHGAGADGQVTISWNETL